MQHVWKLLDKQAVIYVQNWKGQYIRPSNSCPACNGTGESYWSDDVEDSCMECCWFECDERRLKKDDSAMPEVNEEVEVKVEVKE